jgi:DNA repair photolyase
VIEKLLSELMMPNVIVHCSITGWGGSVLEPNIPAPEITLAAYKSLSGWLGEDRIVLRIDPIVVSIEGFTKATKIAAHKIGRMRISFLDVYPHVKRIFKENNLAIHETFHAPENIRKEMWIELGKPETCAEPGLPSVGCISEVDCKILGVEPKPLFKGQRPLCTCLANKFELLTKKEPCGHGCLYCYWKGF